jgi:HTH-type transcriptional regulator/antitoxin MqsA
MTQQLDKCPTCGSRKIRAHKKDLVFTYRGRTICVPQVECEECPDCGEIITDYAANHYIDSVVFSHARQRAS